MTLSGILKQFDSHSCAQRDVSSGSAMMAYGIARYEFKGKNLLSSYLFWE